MPPGFIIRHGSFLSPFISKENTTLQEDGRTTLLMMQKHNWLRNKRVVNMVVTREFHGAKFHLTEFRLETVASHVYTARATITQLANVFMEQHKYKQKLQLTIFVSFSKISGAIQPSVPMPDLEENEWRPIASFLHKPKSEIIAFTSPCALGYDINTLCGLISLCTIKEND